MAPFFLYIQQDIAAFIQPFASQKRDFICDLIFVQCDWLKKIMENLFK
jgi:hypothetical protein